jgi:chloramphenicol 3-O-phosphotransferase
MSLPDTEDKIIADLLAAVSAAATLTVRRAVKLGRALEKDEVLARVQQAINGTAGAGAGPIAPDVVRANASLTASMANLESSLKGALAAVKFPYGHVKRTVAKALYDHRKGGATRQELSVHCLVQYDTELTESALQTALRTLSSAGSARYSEPKQRWFPTHALIEELEKEDPEQHDAPKPEAQGHLAEVNS